MQAPLPGSWTGRRVVVTGSTGFKGSWLSLWLLRLGASVVGLGLTPPPDGAFEAMQLAEEFPTASIDIRDTESVRRLIEAHRPDVVFHLAAQALVSEGYRDPLGTFTTNVSGTGVILEAARGCPAVRGVVVVTSDKVYRPGTGIHSESDPLGGDDPYSASKAAAEMVARGYASVVGQVPAIATARAGNVIGGGDRARDRLIPDVIRAVAAREPVRIRHPDFVRPWQHVLEPLEGYLRLAALLLEGGPHPSAVNFGPSAAAMTVEDLVGRMLARLGVPPWERTAGEFAEQPRLELDSGLASAALGWTARLDADEMVDWTAEWYRAQLDAEDMVAVSVAQIDRYARLCGTVARAGAGGAPDA